MTLLIICIEKGVIEGLTHYWSFGYGLNDLVNGVPMKLEANAELTEDRLGQSESALSLVNSFASIPAGNYFSNLEQEFSISIWVNFLGLSGYQRIFDFGNDVYRDPVIFFNSLHKVIIYIEGDYYYFPGELEMNKWYHYAFSLKNSKLKTYHNGSLINELTFKSLPFKYRKNNYFGKDWNGSYNSNEKLSDIMFFKKALSDEEMCYIAKA